MQPYLVSLSFMLCVIGSLTFPLPRKFGRNTLGSNCTGLDGKCKRFQEIVEIDKIKGNIIRTLCKKDENGRNYNPFCDLVRNLTVMTTKRPPLVVTQSPRPIKITFKEVISFSENASENKTDRNIIKFNIDVRNEESSVKAISSHLWIRLKKRRKSRSRSSRGKKIFLQISRLHDQDDGYDFLTRIRTRVKRSRWQKISLPITLAQSILDSSDKTLKLRIDCRKCGREVRPVLSRRKSGRRKHRKRNRQNKQKRQKRFKRKKDVSSGYRSKSFRKNVRTGPFLVTRYEHKLQRRLDHGS